MYIIRMYIIRMRRIINNIGLLDVFVFVLLSDENAASSRLEVMSDSIAVGNVVNAECVRVGRLRYVVISVT